VDLLHRLLYNLLYSESATSRSKWSLAHWPLTDSAVGWVGQVWTDRRLLLAGSSSSSSLAIDHNYNIVVESDARPVGRSVGVSVSTTAMQIVRRQRVGVWVSHLPAACHGMYVSCRSGPLIAACGRWSRSYPSPSMTHTPRHSMDQRKPTLRDTISLRFDGHSAVQRRRLLLKPRPKLHFHYFELLRRGVVATRFR